MHVVSVTATKNRHSCLERLLGMLINQDYEGEHTILVYNNSKDEQVLELPRLPENKKVYYIHQWEDSVTNLPYSNLGAIYNDVLVHIEKAVADKLLDPVDVITHADDDDMFLPNHISEGVLGYKRALTQGKLAYKPERSYYRHAGGIDLISNTLEPSIFLNYEFLTKYKYSNTTSDQHLQWVIPLSKEDKIFVDPVGKPTLIYDWNSEFPTFKTSGNPTNILNFYNYENFSKDKGDGIITPWPVKYLERYYKEV